jgi:hypothetical protein
MSIAGLQAVREADGLDGKQYAKAASPFFKQSSEINKELNLLKKQWKIIFEDMEDAIVVKRRRDNRDEASVDFLERAYVSTIVPKVMNAIAHKKKQNFKGSIFRNNVLKAYNALENRKGLESAWCHLTGWWDKKLVKAAHLVPKCLKPAEISFLFGVQEVKEDFFYDWWLGK